MRFFEKLHEQLFSIKENYFGETGRKRFVPSRIFLKKYYFERLGKQIDFDHPKLLSEKLNWLKIYYHDPLMTLCADKYRMRRYVKRALGADYTPRVLGVWSSPKEIDFDTLPKKFVLKTNHDGCPIICIDKNKLDINATRDQLAEKLRADYYLRGREWSYKNIKRLIFAEEFLETPDGDDLVDYKIFCFNGDPKYIRVTSEHTDPKHGRVDHFDLDFCHLPFVDSWQPADHQPNKPENLAEMIEIAKKLASFGDFPFVRVDLYSIGDKIYVGELTFYPKNGMLCYHPEEWNKITGDYLTLPKKNGWRKIKGRNKKWLRQALK